MRINLYGILFTVKIDSETCTIVEDVIEEDQVMLGVWLIELIFISC